MNKKIYLFLCLMIALSWTVSAAAPTFSEVTSSDNNPYVTQVVKLSSNVTGDIGVDQVWLSTNESGAWVNYSARNFSKMYEDFGYLSDSFKRRSDDTYNDIVYLYLDQEGYIGTGLNSTYIYSDSGDYFNIKHQFSVDVEDFSSYNKVGFYAEADNISRHKSKPAIYDSLGDRCDPPLTGDYKGIDSTDWKEYVWDLSSFDEDCDKTSIVAVGFQLNDVTTSEEVEGSVLFDELYAIRGSTEEKIKFHWRNNNIREATSVGWKICASNADGSACTSTQTLTLKTYQEETSEQIKQESGSIQTKLYNYDSRILSKDSYEYEQPSQEQKEILLKAFRELDQGYYALAPVTASAVNYSVINFTDTTLNKNYYILEENQTNSRGWGYYVIYPEYNNKDLLIQIVHPLHDINTIYYGADAFINTSARYYFLSGAHRYTNLNEQADPSHTSESAFRELTNHLQKPSLNILQIHGFNSSYHEDCAYNNVVAEGNLSYKDIHQGFCNNLTAQGFNCTIASSSSCPELAAVKNVLGKDTRDNKATFIHVESSEVVRFGSENQAKFVKAVMDTWSTNKLATYGLEQIYEDNTEAIFRFNIKNYNGTTLNNINWSLNTGENTIYATNLINLGDNEDIFIYIANDYSSTGEYDVTATAFTGDLQDEQTITIMLGLLFLFTPAVFKKKRLLFLILGITILGMGLLAFTPQTTASSSDIGYEYVDNNNYLHTWNQNPLGEAESNIWQDTDSDYSQFFNGETLEEAKERAKWLTNKFSIGYYNGNTFTYLSQNHLNNPEVTINSDEETYWNQSIYNCENHFCAGFYREQQLEDTYMENSLWWNTNEQFQLNGDFYYVWSMENINILNNNDIDIVKYCYLTRIENEITEKCDQFHLDNTDSFEVQNLTQLEIADSTGIGHYYLPESDTDTRLRYNGDSKIHLVSLIRNIDDDKITIHWIDIHSDEIQVDRTNGVSGYINGTALGSGNQAYKNVDPRIGRKLSTAQEYRGYFTFNISEMPQDANVTSISFWNELSNLQPGDNDGPSAWKNKYYTCDDCIPDNNGLDTGDWGDGNYTGVEVIWKDECGGYNFPCEVWTVIGDDSNKIAIADLENAIEDNKLFSVMIRDSSLYESGQHWHYNWEITNGGVRPRVKIQVNYTSESESRQAILEGINNIIPNSVKQQDQQVYTVNFANAHTDGEFDIVAIWNNQTWAFNYILGDDSYQNVNPIYTTVNTWENESLTYAQTVSQVETLINNTLN